MLSLEVYRLLHIIGLLMTFSGLMGLLGTRLASQTAVTKFDSKFMMLHGIGLTLLIVSGFGMLARLGLTQGLPPWIYVKLAIWLTIGGTLTLAKRKIHLGMFFLSGWILLGALAGYLGIFKPF